MSTTVPASTNGHYQPADGVRTYRGRRLEDLIPRIRTELGPDAIILREREGLMGGINGFFAQRFVEVDAHAGTPRIDLYDEEPEDLSFAGRLEQATAAAPGPAPEPEPVPEPDAAAAEPEPQISSRRSPRLLSRKPAPAPARQLDAQAAAAVTADLLGRGVSAAWAGQLVEEAAAHHTPFADASLRDAVRAMIATSLSRSRPLPAGGAAIAFVGTGGAGKTRCVATLAAAYRRASTLPVTVISVGSRDRARQLSELLRGPGVSVAALADGRALARRVEKARDGGLVVLDTSAISPSDADGVRSLAALLGPLALDGVYLALPATLGAETARRLLGSLAPLQLSGLAITHVDETDQLGVAVELACASGTPVNYLHEGLELERALAAVDPISLSERLLP